MVLSRLQLSHSKKQHACLLGIITFSYVKSHGNRNEFESMYFTSGRREYIFNVCWLTQAGRFTLSKVIAIAFLAHIHENNPSTVCQLN